MNTEEPSSEQPPPPDDGGGAHSHNANNHSAHHSSTQRSSRTLVVILSTALAITLIGTTVAWTLLIAPDRSSDDPAVLPSRLSPSADKDGLLPVLPEEVTVDEGTEMNPLKYAFIACGSGYPLGYEGVSEAESSLSENETTLTITVDTDFADGPNSYPWEDYGLKGQKEAGCLIGALQTPPFVIEEMVHTREIDGLRTASWDQLEAVWSYDADVGLRISVTTAE